MLMLSVMAVKNTTNLQEMQPHSVVRHATPDSAATVGLVSKPVCYLEMRG